MKAPALTRAADTVVLDRVSSGGPAEVVGRVLSASARGGTGWAVTSAVLAAVGGEYRRAGVEGLAAWAAAEAAAAAIKPATSRSRPRRPRGRSRTRSSSLPSSHTASGIAYAVAAGARAPKLAAPHGLAALAVGWSRMENRRHFPSDVLAGTALGVAIGSSTAAAARRI